jgi:hypothetical protein
VALALLHHGISLLLLLLLGPGLLVLPCRAAACPCRAPARSLLLLLMCGPSIGWRLLLLLLL